MADKKHRTTPCPVCSGGEFSSGFLLGQGLKFIPETEGWQSRTASIVAEVEARQCLSCGNLQLFVGGGE